MDTRCDTDGRRELGEQTRRRLLEAAQTLVAEHGEDAVTLRAITDAANANVAAVSYHFGSKDALLRTAVEQAVRLVTTEQLEALRSLPDAPALADVARAIARPIVAAVATGYPQDRALLRIAARVINDPTGSAEHWLRPMLDEKHREMVAVLSRSLPGVPEDVLRFRAQSCGAVLNCVAAGRTDVDGRSVEELEALVVPVIAGMLGGEHAGVVGAAAA